MRLVEEHQELRARDKSITLLDPPDTIQIQELRARLRTEQLTAGRFRALLRLSSTKMAADLRRQKLAECEAESAHLSKLIARITKGEAVRLQADERCSLQRAYEARAGE